MMSHGMFNSHVDYCNLKSCVIVSTHRSLDYGVTFDNIESNLDPNANNPLLWYSFFVSPVNKNMVNIITHSSVLE